MSGASAVDGPGDAVRAVRDLLTRAAHDRQAGALRWPVLASAARGGGADARMLVLRQFDRENGVLELHSDARSEKIAQLREQPCCTLLFFDARSNIQLGVRACARVHCGDEVARRAFAQAPEGSLDDYRGAAPGARLDDNPARSDEAEANFAVIRLVIEAADWLKLDRDGHRRWRVDFSGEAPAAWAIEP